MKKQNLFAKLQVIKPQDLKKLGITHEEINYIKDKLLNDKLGLKLNFTEINSEEKTNYLLLEELEELGINQSKNSMNNLLIEGDNYHALKALKIAGVKIDVIYIDPPYNTGNSDFIYNDDYGMPRSVNGDDPHKHSKWLSFMKKRLEISRELLNEDGVIFVSIDDNEQAYLKVLMDEIFGEKNSVASVVVQKKSGGGQAKYYYKGHDHLFVYAKNAREINSIYVDHKNRQFKSVMIEGKRYHYLPDSMRKMHGKFKREKLKDGTIDHRNLFLEDYKIQLDEDKAIEIEKKLESKEIIPVWFESKKAHILSKVITERISENNKLLYSIITSWTYEGQKTFNSIFPERQKEDGNWFHAPKPVSLLKYILKHNLKKGIVLDFFAGSGTTGQAVMELNQEDGGNRRFILCTNNEMKGVDTIKYPEKGIARDICRERIYRVINGKGSKNEEVKWAYSNDYKSLPSNSLSYLKVKLLDKYEGDFEDIDKIKKLYKKEFNINISIRDFKE